MKIRVREAKQRERGLFRKLWSAYIKDQYEKGGLILPSKANLEVFEQIFDKYTSKELPGIVLFVAEDAILMWGFGGDNPFETKLGKIAQGWGTYVGPTLRGKGISKALREEAGKKIKDLGFDAVLGSGLKENEEGIASGTKYGFEEHSSNYILKLTKEK